MTEKTSTATDRVKLGELVKKPTRQLSLGERMKCELAAALLHRPKVLFLDEPTIGLDVGMQTAVRHFIRSYNERFGATVLLTSHYMDDVAALCPRVIVINEGKLKYDGQLDGLVKRVRPEKRLSLRLGKQVEPEALKALGLGQVVKHEGTQVVLQVPQDRLQEVIARVLGSLQVADLTAEDAPLEEVWNSPWAQQIRASILDGSYRYCIEKNCPHLRGEAHGVDFARDGQPRARAAVDAMGLVLRHRNGDAGALGRQRLQQQGRLADARVAADQHHATGHDAAAEHPVQFLLAGGRAFIVAGLDLGQRRHRLASGQRLVAVLAAATGLGGGFGQGVPGAAVRAFAQPLGVGAAAFGAGVDALGGGHGAIVAGHDDRQRPGCCGTLRA